MFEIFKSDAKKIRKLNHDFEQIVFAFDSRMNEYEKYSLASALGVILYEKQQVFNQIHEFDRETWKRIANKLAQEFFDTQQFLKKLSGIGREGGEAGILALALLVIKAKVKSFDNFEAQELDSKIGKFEDQMSEYLKVIFDDDNNEA